MNIDHILVTSDLSPESLRPIQPVTTLARVVSAKITLLHVVQDLKITPHGAPFAPAVSSPDLEKDFKHAQLVLEEQRTAMGADLEVLIDVVASSDIPAAINAYAKEHGVNLIAISTHGRTGIRHLIVGSVAESVIRTADVPVLSFPRQED